MAIYHLSMKQVSRTTGRSAVAAAAYRAGAVLTNERDGQTHDFTRKQGIIHAEIVLPEGTEAKWASDRSALWNASELAEKRKDACVALEFELALPHELSRDEQIDLTRDFAQSIANRYRAGVDFAVHLPDGNADIRNTHAHLLVTTRKLEADGPGEKIDLKRRWAWLHERGLASPSDQLRAIRLLWQDMANECLARAGHEVRIDHRSHEDRGLEVAPTVHVGVHATQMERRGLQTTRTRLSPQDARHNAELLLEKPEELLRIVTDEKSVFDRRDIARTLHRYIDDDAELFGSVLAAVMGSQSLVELQPQGWDGSRKTPARYSTTEMVFLEGEMARSAWLMRVDKEHPVDHGHVRKALDRQDEALRQAHERDTACLVLAGKIDRAEQDRQIAAAGLSDEQRRAVEHITGPRRIAAVVGYAGAGKSTMLSAAREAWEAQGYRVHGGTLAGKAAEGLEESSGIASRTLASWEYRWGSRTDQLGSKDVLVIDEAGMVGSRQMARIVETVRESRAKLVLVGDPEQLQAIGAGAPFRAIMDIVGHAELARVRRQRVDWQREASVALATHRTREALDAYRSHGAVRFSDDAAQARQALVSDWLADREAWPDMTRMVMAHRRVDVRALNESIRTALKERGELGGAAADPAHPSEAPAPVDSREIEYRTRDGRRSFAAGDRILFLENNSALGVKNGTLGTVTAVEADCLTVAPDGGPEGRSAPLRVSVADYAAFDHGYAATIHKNQGITVDHSFVLASSTMDRHLAYVALTRHRDDVRLYVDWETFAAASDRQVVCGRLVAHGAVSKDNAANYYVTVEGGGGDRQTVWGPGLARAMEECGPAIGDRIGLEKVAERRGVVEWRTFGRDDLAFRQLQVRLDRSGLKETTLDYRNAFAGCRGMGAVDEAACASVRPGIAPWDRPGPWHLARTDKRPVPERDYAGIALQLAQAVSERMPVGHAVHNMDLPLELETLAWAADPGVCGRGMTDEQILDRVKTVPYLEGDHAMLAAAVGKALENGPVEDIGDLRRERAAILEHLRDEDAERFEAKEFVPRFRVFTHNEVYALHTPDTPWLDSLPGCADDERRRAATRLAAYVEEFQEFKAREKEDRRGSVYKTLLLGMLEPEELRQVATLFRLDEIRALTDPDVTSPKTLLDMREPARKDMAATLNRIVDRKHCLCGAPDPVRDGVRYPREYLLKDHTSKIPWAAFRDELGRLPGPDEWSVSSKRHEERESLQKDLLLGLVSDVMPHRLAAAFGEDEIEALRVMDAKLPYSLWPMGQEGRGHVATSLQCLSRSLVGRLSKLSDETVEGRYADIAFRMACAMTERSGGEPSDHDRPLVAHVSQMLARAEAYPYLPAQQVDQLAGEIAAARQAVDLRVAVAGSVQVDFRIEDAARFTRNRPRFATPHRDEEFDQKYEAARAAAPEPKPDWLDRLTAKCTLMPFRDQTVATAMSKALQRGTPPEKDVLLAGRRQLARQLTDGHKATSAYGMSPGEKYPYITQAYRVFTAREIADLTNADVPLPPDLNAVKGIDKDRIAQTMKQVFDCTAPDNNPPWASLQFELLSITAPDLRWSIERSRQEYLTRSRSIDRGIDRGLSMDLW